MSATPHSWLDVAVEPGIVRRSLIVAAIVGTVLNVINQGDALGGALNWWKLALTYCVPYLVSTYGAVTARIEAARRTR